jgi:hypothetical protein
MSTLSAGTTLTTSLVASGDTTGQLVLQTNGTTPAVTIGTDQNVTLQAGVINTPAATSLVLKTAGTNAVTIGTNQNVVCNSTGAFTIPVGTTAQRPASPQVGQMRYNTTLSQYEFYDGTNWANVPVTNNYSIEMFAWGGGGGGAGNSGYGAGGGGGAANGTMAVTPSTAFAVVVGGGGSSQGPGAGPGTAPAGGGGTAGSSGYGGQGGGYSGIFSTSASQANARLIAGGGGGAGYDGSSAQGGPGGGTNGVAGTGGGAGSGGTQSGSSGYPAGTALQGGSPNTPDGGGGGGGGGGYYGGGAGGNGTPTDSSGGGGSGYFNSSFVTSATLTAGSGTTPGDSSNSLRGSYGNGGAAGANAGTQGVFIIRYTGGQRGTGGTVTSSGGYTYHTFTSAGTFTA